MPVASDIVIWRCNERQGRPRRDRKRPHCPEAGEPIGRAQQRQAANSNFDMVS